MIPFVDLNCQYRQLKSEIDQNIQRVLDHGRFILGPEVFALEEKLAEYVGVKHCITVSSGTDALLIPLMAWGIGPGDAVFTTSFTFAATAEVICLAGATPIFVDIDPNTYNLDPSTLDKAITRVLREGMLAPKAIIAVDLFGLPADYGRISELARQYQLKVLEDAAQSFGGEVHGQKAGSLGDVAATSFFPAKPLGCYGDGGAIFTNEDSMADIARSIRVHGKGTDKYNNVRMGLNARLDTLQAAILLAKLKAFTEYERAARNKHAALYTEGLKDVIKTPFVPKGYLSSWAQYSLVAKTTDQRSAMQQKLKGIGIPTAIYYPCPLHRQAVYQKYPCDTDDFPVASHISSRIFSIPMHPYLDRDTLNTIITTIRTEVSGSPSVAKAESPHPDGSG